MIRPLVLTPGEPAGIGPEIACRVAADHPGLVLVADPGLLAATAERLELDLDFHQVGEDLEARPDGTSVLPVTLDASIQPGVLDKAAAPYVLACLRRASDLCLSGRAGGLVTGPVHKGVLNEAGLRFTGHTELLASEAGVDQVVMMLAAGNLRVALATTHLPLKDVATHLTRDRLRKVIRVLHDDLVQRFGIQEPRVRVLGLNPHAGEGGHLGREELDIIGPVVDQLRQGGMDLEGPVSADTAFLPDSLGETDAILAMFHDQGLPVLKYAGFGQAVNVTLGLPYIRTSVDHGTALDLAGTGKADHRSLLAAVDMARSMRPPAG